MTLQWYGRKSDPWPEVPALPACELLSAGDASSRVASGAQANGGTMREVALITGASRGLGAALASFLAAQGYDLVLTARDARALHQAAAGIAALGTEVRAPAGDVGDDAHRRRLIEEAHALGRLNLLINNAADLGGAPPPPLADFALDRLRRLFEVNTLAPLRMVQEALPLLRESRGLVINVTTDAAVAGYPGWGGYGASKAALDLLTRTLSRELADEGVAVVGVDPGDMRTRMHQAAFPGVDISDRPLPEATLPFWAWLLGQDPSAISGQRFLAQAETWEVAE